MRFPKRAFLAVLWSMAIVGAASQGTPTAAQTAYRCEVNGATVYSEKPCADAKSALPTQDSDQQKQRSREASQQLKADNKDVDRQIADRQKREAAERDSIRKAAKKSSATSDKQTKKKRRTRHTTHTEILVTESNAAKLEKSKPKRDKGTLKRDNRGSKPT